MRRVRRRHVAGRRVGWRVRRVRWRGRVGAALVLVAAVPGRRRRRRVVRLPESVACHRMRTHPAVSCITHHTIMLADLASLAFSTPMHDDFFQGFDILIKDQTILVFVRRVSF